MEYVHICNTCLPELSLSYEVCLNPKFWNSYFRRGSRACYWWSTGDFCLFVFIKVSSLWFPTQVNKKQQDQRENWPWLGLGFQSCTAGCWFHVRQGHFPFWHKPFPKSVLWAIGKHHTGFFLCTPSDFLVITGSHLNHLCVGVGNLWQRLAQGVMNRLNKRDGNKCALNPPVLYSRICLCFSRVALSFPSFFFKPPHWYQFYFKTGQRWDI